MRYSKKKIKESFNKYQNSEYYSHLYKWIKKNKTINEKNRNLLLFHLDKKYNSKLNSFIKIYKICHITWRSRAAVVPFNLSKTAIKYFISNNWINGLIRK